MKKRPFIVIRLFIISVLFISLATSCKKDNDDTETVTDIDGNVYNTVTIGTQVWLKENLKTTKYRNGDAIGTTNPPTLDYSSESTPKYQWACDGNESNVSVYGRLYTGYAVTDSRGLCPTGWHVATRDEWITLIDFVGGEMVAGGILKEKGTSHWNAPNTDAIDKYGFTAVPAGWRDYDGEFGDKGKYALWWTSSQFESYPNNLWYVQMKDNSAGAPWSQATKNWGSSVRCIKD
jgi:uncharacterized protein (TIGR02145 family)